METSLKPCPFCGQRTDKPWPGKMCCSGWAHKRIAELKALNIRAKEVLEKTLDCEQSACVARNRLEIKIAELEKRNIQINNSRRADLMKHFEIEQKLKAAEELKEAYREGWITAAQSPLQGTNIFNEIPEVIDKEAQRILEERNKEHP